MDEEMVGRQMMRLIIIMCRLLRRENRKCSRLQTMAERSTSIQQEKTDLRLNKGREENVRVSWKATAMHQLDSFVRLGKEWNRQLHIKLRRRYESLPCIKILGA